MTEVLDLSSTLHESPQPKYPEGQEQWKLSDGRYAVPDPSRFKELAENVPRGDIPQMAKVVVRYALERAGLILTPEQLSEPLSRLETADDLERTKIIDSFLEYCDIAEQIGQRIDDAADLLDQYSFDQVRLELPKKTSGADNLAAIKIVRAMHKSEDEAFNRMGSMVKSHSTAILRIMYGWEKGIDDLPKPGDHLNSVS